MYVRRVDSSALVFQSFITPILIYISDKNADFEAAIEILVADMVAQVPVSLPAGPNE